MHIISMYCTQYARVRSSICIASRHALSVFAYLVNMANHKKKRICDSLVSVHELQEVLLGWFQDRGTRSVQHLLQIVNTQWSATVMPKPSQLVHPDIYSAMIRLVQIDPTLHPRRKYVELALQAEHKHKPIFLETTPLEQKLAWAAKLLMLACAKYRDLHTYPEKWASVAEKAIHALSKTNWFSILQYVMCLFFVSNYLDNLASNCHLGTHTSWYQWPAIWIITTSWCQLPAILVFNRLSIGPASWQVHDLGNIGPPSW